MKKIIIVLFSFFCILSLGAQESTAMNNIKNCMSNIMLFNRVLPQEKVYLHFDNTGYFKGETIWFKAYVVRTDSLVLSNRSRVLYVELLTQNGDVIETQKLMIHNGQADGCVKLDNKILESGFYEVRAYTRYMTNWDCNCVFSRVFPIFDVPRKPGEYSRPVIDMDNYRRRQPNAREKVDSTCDGNRKINAVFYPEGGNLVVGLPGNVAYDIIDSHGAHADARVCVVDGKDTLAKSSTEYMGRGVISFIPKSAKSKLIVTDALNHRCEYEMPEVIKTGYVMNVSTVDSGYVTVHIKSTPDLYDSMIGLLLTHCGMVEALDTVTVVKNGVKIKINSTDMDDGVNQLTLIGADCHIVADRMIFNYPQQDVSIIHITTPEKSLGPCKKVTLNAEVWTKSTFSLAVRDRATETNGYGQDVRTWMLLTSDLRGFIERPEFYFERNDFFHRRAADLLMMIQGWHRYDMNVMSGQKIFTKKQPYEDGLYVDGMIYPRTKGDLMENITLSVTLYNKHGEVMQGETETYKGGIYDAKLPDCYGEWTLLMNASRGMEPVSCYMGINRQFSPKCRGLSYSELQMIPVEDANILFEDSTEVNDSVVPMDKKGHLLKEVSVKGHRVYDKARSAWENERRGAYSATLYYDCAKAADGVADKGERMPGFLDWLVRRNNLFSGTSIINPDEIVDYPHRYRLQKEVQRNRNLAKSSIEKNRIEMMGSNDDEISLVSSNGKVRAENLEKVDENNVNLISRIFDTGYKYKNRPVIWIMNNKFACITGYDGKFRIDDIMGDVDYSLDGLPETLDEAKSVYISEDENVWQHYISDNDLVKIHPITVFVYTFHEFARDMRGLRRTHFEGFATPETFKMADYSQMPPVADYRRTLYWNPNVTTDDKGKATVAFYNNSSCRQMIISAEGITSEGFPIIYKTQ